MNIKRCRALAACRFSRLHDLPEGRLAALLVLGVVRLPDAAGADGEEQAHRAAGLGLESGAWQRPVAAEGILKITYNAIAVRTVQVSMICVSLPVLT